MAVVDEGQRPPSKPEGGSSRLRCFLGSVEVDLRRRGDKGLLGEWRGESWVGVEVGERKREATSRDLDPLSLGGSVALFMVCGTKALIWIGGITVFEVEKDEKKNKLLKMAANYR